MGLTEEIKKGLDIDLESKFAAAVDKGICNGAYDAIFSDGNKNNTKSGKKINNSKKKELSSIYGTSTKTLEIRSQLEKIIDMIDHTDPDYISIDIKVKTLTSKQRYKHKGSRTKAGIFE